MVKKKGKLFIVSAPSGAGKSTLINEILKYFPDIVYSISHTTRSPRKGETNGKEYFFISRKEFEKGIADHLWAEWANVHGNYYGTGKIQLETHMTAGSDVLLDIDVQGAYQIMKIYPDSISIFIMPPSIEVLKERLLKRSTENEQDIKIRLKNAEKEILEKNNFKHLIINDKLPDSTQNIVSLIEKYRK